MTALLETGPLEDGIGAHAADLLFRDAHTAMNSQPMRVVLLKSAQAKARLMPHLAEGNRAKVQSAPVVAILAADTDFHVHLPRVLPQAPGAKALFSDDAAREKSARFNATLQAGYFILAVRAAGLSAGPLGGFDAVGVDRDLLGDGPLKSVLLVSIGTAAADGTFPRNPRLGVGEFVTTL